MGPFPIRCKLLSIKETCELIGVGRTATYGLIRDGSLDRCKIGRRSLVTLESIEKLIEANIK